jgi:hypothetical protein
MKGILALTVACAVTTVTAQSGGAVPAVALAREALGGDAALTSLRSLHAAGRLVREDGTNQASAAFDLAWMLPDKFVCRETGSVTGVNWTNGFNGADLLQDVHVLYKGIVIVAPMAPAAASEARKTTARRATLTANRQAFALWMLGWTAASADAYPLTFAPGHTPANSTADAVEVQGPDGFRGVWLIDRVSHLPRSVTWAGPTAPTSETTYVTSTDPRAPMAPARPKAAPGKGPDGKPLTGHALEEEREQRHEREEAALEARLAVGVSTVLHSLTFADYQRIGDVRLPRRVTLEVTGQPREIWLFDTIVVNPTIDPKIFTVKRN